MWMFFAGVGTLFMSIGCALAARNIRFVRRGVAVQGKVVGRSSLEGVPGERRHYMPKVQYTDHNNRVHVITGEVGSPSRTLYPPDMEIAVLYDPDQPGDARINTFTQMWLFPVGMCGFALILATFAALLFFGEMPPAHVGK